jgi:hypothetical protein
MNPTTKEKLEFEELVKFDVNVILASDLQTQKRVIFHYDCRTTVASYEVTKRDVLHGPFYNLYDAVKKYNEI